MKNKLLQSLTVAEKAKKLDVTLRRLTGDRLTEAQRHMIGAAIGGKRQFAFRVLRSPDLPDLPDGMVRQPIFGDLRGVARGPTAVMFRQTRPGQQKNVVYIYLPGEKEELRDESREEETMGP